MENAQPEPSMEEILASIRRIISEDEEEASADAAAPTGAAEPAPAAERSKPELVADAEESADPEPAETELPTAENTDVVETRLETEDVEMIKENVATAVKNDLVNETTASAASDAFQTLTQTVRVSEGEGRTLEDIVIEMVRPMIKDWLDANLPSIVEEKVEDEVQRLARRRT